MNSVNSRLGRNFSCLVNFQPVFSSDSVNIAGPLSKTTTKSLSQPILFSNRPNEFSIFQVNSRKFNSCVVFGFEPTGR